MARACLIAVGFLSNRFHILVDFSNALITAGLEDLCSKFPEWALMFFLRTASHIFLRLLWIESHISCESPDVLQSKSCAIFTISRGENLCQSFFVAVVYTLWERARLQRIPMWSDFPSRRIA